MLGGEWGSEAVVYKLVVAAAQDAVATGASG